MRDRIISAVILISLFVLFYILGGIYFVTLVSFVGVLAYKEMAFLKKYPPIIIIIGLISILSIIILNSKEYSFSLGLSTLSIVFPIVFLVIPTLLPRFSKDYPISSAFEFIGFIYLVGLGLASINSLFLTDKLLLLYVVLITVLNDTFAFIIGTLIGKHKFSKISPKKSIEGLLAGSIVGTIGGVFFYLTFIESDINIMLILFITIALNISCQVGDLVFSKIKREHNIKDFSNIIKGHGGILDRCDSIIFTSLVFIIILALFK